MKDLNTANQSSIKINSHTNIVFALIIVAYFLDVIDFSIVQVALPTIRSQFAITLADSQWVIGAYGITLAGFLMLSGRAGDIYGQKKIFISGIILFTIASFFAGLAPTFFILTLMRLIQGVGAAMSTVTAFAILIELFPEGKERNQAMGIFIAVLSAGFAAGSVLGGILTVLWGWRSVMFVNVPIGFAAAYLSRKYISNGHRITRKKHLDLPGAMSITGGLILLVFSLTNAANNDISYLHTGIPFIISLILLFLFILIESRSKDPLIPPLFLQRGSVLTANLLSLILSSTVTGVSFIVTVYLQQILHFSPLYAGLSQLPGALIFFFIGGWGASWCVNRFGARKILLISTLFITGGIALLTRMSIHGNYVDVLPGMLLWSLGASLGFPALNIIALSGIRPGEEGLASGLLNTSFRVGSPLGLAVLLIVAGVTSPVHSETSNLIISAQETVIGFHWALYVATFLGVIGFFIANRMKIKL
jgi:EmrB/QacA subfamily drug resistance transporter